MKAVAATKLTKDFLQSNLKALMMRFRQEAKGVAAVEFALIAPLMIVLYLGTLEVSAAVSVDRKLSRISSTVADLITQTQADLTAEDVADIMKISSRIMYPYSYKPSIVVSGLDISSANGTVRWSCAVNGSAAAKNSTVSVPPRILKSGTFLVSATVSLNYQPMVAWASTGTDHTLDFASTAIPMSETLYLKPRLKNVIDITGNC